MDSLTSLYRVVNRCDADLRKSEASYDIHGRHYVLMLGIGVGTDRQGQIVIASRDFL